jgi:hypothetical protein
VAGPFLIVMAALSGEVVRRATGQTVQSLFGTLLRDRYKLDLHFGLPASEKHCFLPAQPMTATPERLRELAAAASAPDSDLNPETFEKSPFDRAAVLARWGLPLARGRDEGARSGGHQFGGDVSEAA